ncbi:MAG: T9SS type A sorting domain-containing protein, partial [Saprospiraceae bacterium]|nr:T9SS type A sorting domain-containing protein [Saprospiraceae bacterium]
EVPVFLKSVKVYAENKGGRIIKLYDAEGNSLATKLLNITEIGEQSIDLNINIPRGTDYYLTIDAGKSLAHNISNIDFPYAIDGVIQITKARDGDADTRFRYYYFYDWEVHALSACGKIPVDLVPSTTDTASMVDFDQSVDTTNFFPDIEVQFTDLSADPVSWIWDFANGNSSLEQNPTNTYQMPGVYHTSLTIRDSKGCNNSVIYPLTLLETSAVKEGNSYEEQPLLFPNPAFDQITLYLPASFMELTKVKCTILDIQGKIVKEVIPSKGYQEVNVDISNLPSGLFILTTSTENGVIATNRFVKQ